MVSSPTTNDVKVSLWVACNMDLYNWKLQSNSNRIKRGMKRKQYTWTEGQRKETKCCLDKTDGIKNPTSQVVGCVHTD